MSIEFQTVSKSFGSKTILNQVSFKVENGEILFVIGKSGVGKSVTLKHIVGMMGPESGSVRVDDQNVSEMVACGDRAGLEKVRQNCGMVFQFPALLDSLSVYENLSFGLRHKKISEDEKRKKIFSKLNLVNLNKKILDRYPTELSFGMQKRVSLARTIVPEPSYLLFDEPTTGLDPITKTAINDLIFDLSRKLKVTSLVVSHDMDCALKIADRIMVLDQGKILAIGSVKEISNSKEPLIVDFLSEALEANS